MTRPAACRGDADCMMAYETLRTQLLGGTTAGSQTTLGVLLRQGVAAWMDNRSTFGWPPIPSAVHAAPPAPDVECNTAMVQLLASMALAGYQEMRV